MKQQQEKQASTNKHDNKTAPENTTLTKQHYNK